MKQSTRWHKRPPEIWKKKDKAAVIAEERIQVYRQEDEEAAKNEEWPRGLSLNSLYYGDNLEVLRLHIKDKTVDLVYQDPPFKSDQDYKVLFAEQDSIQSAA